jgi:hypothetical protein
MKHDEANMVFQPETKNIQISSSFKEFNNIFKTMLKTKNIWLTMNRNISILQHIHENNSDMLVIPNV